MMTKVFLLILSGFIAVGLLAGCGEDEDALKTVIEAYDEADSYTIELNTENQSSGVTATLLGKFEDNREYVQLGSDEYYREIGDETIVIYDKTADDGWSREEVVNDSSGDDSLSEFSAHVAQGHLSHEWFTHSNDRNYDLNEDEYRSMFTDAYDESVTECRLRILDDGFQIFYTLHTDQGPIDHLVKITAVDTTTVELPEVS
ncbi:MAG: hypothetical protein ACLFUQ_03610 [Candidatus Izemoplasmataceae bacterium]